MPTRRWVMKLMLKRKCVRAAKRFSACAKSKVGWQTARGRGVALSTPAEAHGEGEGCDVWGGRE